MLRNSIEHSKNHCVWICAQYWPSYSMAEIAILDNGIGIRQSLCSNYNYASKINNDSDALKLALLPGITENYGKKQFNGDWNNSGYGLYIASQMCNKLNGSFLLVSDSKALFLCNGKQEIINTNHHGTAIRMTLKTNEKFNYDQIREEILSEGMKISCNIDKAVKKPSKSSSGLMKFIK